jgi:FixJ family two-component response regulator
MPESTVYVVDDDASVREAMQDLLSSFGLHVITFGSAAEYVASTHSAESACLVLDVELPDINGLDLQRQLANGDHPPIVFITGHGDIPSSVRAIKAGAVDFLPKPFTPEQLLAAINTGLQQHRESRKSQSELAGLRSCYASLTPRERDVLPLVVSGLLNKQAAAELGISEVTLQIHRSQVMRKMRADSLADLVRMSIKLGVESSASADGTGASSGDSGSRERQWIRPMT